MRSKLGARLAVVVTTIALAVAVLTVGAGPAAAHGCTPGFWKNKNGAALIGANNPTVGSTFTGFGSSIGSLTMTQALSLQGGPDVAGAREILARAAAAAYFNVTITGDYPKDLAGLQSMVNTALATGDRAAIIAVAADLDFWNNAGNPAVC
jgi:hypothetical protein